MVSRKNKSKKPSDWKSQLRERLTLFIDRNLGKKIIRAELEKLGCKKIITHDDIFAPNAQDDSWIKHVGDSGFVGLTKDLGKRTPLFYYYVCINRACVFTLMEGDASGPSQAAAFVKAFPKILNILRDQSGPSLHLVNLAGKVYPVPLNLIKKRYWPLYRDLPGCKS